MKIYEDCIVVDENDNPIGRAQMPQAYKDGKILRVVEVVVVNSSNELLIQKRGAHILAPGLWGCSAGGHVDHSDTYLEAAERELEEEMGVEASNYIEFLYEYEEVRNSYADFPAKRFRKEFITFSDQIPTIDGDEVIDYKWISLDALKRWVSSSPDVFMPSLKNNISKIEQKLADI